MTVNTQKQVGVMLHFDALPFVDSSANAQTVTLAGSATINTSTPEFGAGCLTLGGGADGVQLPITSGGPIDFCTNAVQWTVEGWFNFASLAVPNGSQTVWSTLGNGVPANYVRLQLEAGGQLNVQIASSVTGNPGNVSTGAGAIAATNTYYHIAVVRDFGNVYIYVNGVLAGSNNATGSGFIQPVGASGTYVGIGNDFLAGIQGTQFVGLVDDFRITNGVALYTQPFTPTGPLADALPTLNLVYPAALNTQFNYSLEQSATIAGVVGTIDFTTSPVTGLDAGALDTTQNAALTFYCESYPDTYGVPVVTFGGNACTVSPVAHGSGSQPQRSRFFAVLPLTTGITFANSQLVIDYTGIAANMFSCTAMAQAWYGVNGSVLLSELPSALAEVQPYGGSPPSMFPFSSTITGNDGDAFLTGGGSYNWGGAATYPYITPNTGFQVQGDALLGISASYYSSVAFKQLTATETDTVTWNQNSSAGGVSFALVMLKLPAAGAPPPVITQQPVNQTVGYCTAATFSVTATGTPTLTYQWSLNGTPISGATADTYTTGPQTGANTGDSYTVAVTDGNSQTTNSMPATVTVRAMTIAQQPLDATVAAGLPAVFSATAINGTAPYSYQWFLNGTAIPGAINQSFSTGPTTPDMSGNTYAVRITDATLACAQQVVTSRAALLTVVSKSTNLTPPALKAYAYQQYSDDDNIVAFFLAYNQLSDTYLQQINALSLPNYPLQSAPLLDWVGTNLYGVPRQSVPVGGGRVVGPLNTTQYNTLAYNVERRLNSGNFYALTDQAYVAVIQWNNYKGDGFQFTTRWLKRRVMRFLGGFLFPDETYQVSVGAVGRTVTITVSAGIAPLTLAPILQAAIEAGLLHLPFQFTFTVVIA